MVNLAGSNRPREALPAEIYELSTRLTGDDPGRPRLTWYGPAGERVELSAKVLANWTAKTANLLVEELDVAPGVRVVLDLPPHWRALPWLLAGWSVGAFVVTSGGADAGGPAAVDPTAGDVWVSTDPMALVAAGVAGPIVAVALPALATRWPSSLPAGVLDGAAETRGRGDLFAPIDRPTPADAAFESRGVVVRYGDMVAAAAAAATDLPAGVRLLTGAGPPDALRGLVAPLLKLGSVVLHHDVDGLTDTARAHLVTQEGITALDRPTPAG